MKNDYLENYTRRYGKYEKAETAEEKDILRGRIEAIDEDGNPLPAGPATDDTSLLIEVIKDKKIKKQFIGRKENESVDFNLKKAFPNDHEIAALLKMQKEEAEKQEGTFRFMIKEISRFIPAELNQELFDRIYGEGVIKSEEEFRERLNGEIEANLKNESDYKLSADIKKLAIEKADFDLPEAFLKRWLLKVNEKTTEEQVEKEFDSFRHDLKWQLIRNKIARTNELKITEEELLREAENITRLQFRQYGLFYATDEQVTNYARETLKREDDAKRIADKILEEKVNNTLREIVKLETRKVSIEEFNRLFEQ
jgi:trigger factor